MKTDEFNNLKVGDRYDEGKYMLAVHADIQTIKYILKALIDETCLHNLYPNTRALELRRFLQDKLEDK